MATKTKKLRILNEIYDALPSVECKGFCHTTCGLINLMPLEELNIEAGTGTRPEMTTAPNIMTGRPMPMIKPNEQEHCPYLVLQRCSIHQHRPLICRIYGTAEGLPCKYGCRPSRILPDKEAEEILRRIEKL